MLRASLALLLLGASAAALAQNGRSATVDTVATCQDIAERSLGERPAETASPVAPDNRRQRAAAVRNKYATPAAAAGLPAGASRGGGDDDDTPLPRSRSSKWHSFLPGMFR